MNKELYRVEEAAELLSLGRTTVFHLIRTGALGSVKIGSARRVPLWAIREYLRGLQAGETAA